MTTINPAQKARENIRHGHHKGHTATLAPGFVQANLVILPEEQAHDFFVFCKNNPKPCPLLAVVSDGKSEISTLAPGSDIRTDLSGYRVWRNGRLVEEAENIKKLWNNKFVSFLIGCSFSFDNLLSVAGIPVRHKDLGKNVSMFRTNIPCVPWGPFRGNMVVSMRPIHRRYKDSVLDISAKLPLCHGEPVHCGKPEIIGIRDVNNPDFGEPVELLAGEDAIFWACGVTPQVILENACLEFAITHKPGHMFITDLMDHQLFDKQDLC